VWQLGRVAQIVDETPRTKSLVLDVPEWGGHRAGQHVDLRLTAEDGYSVERSYSIATGPERGEAVDITVERIADGEVSPFLHDVVVPGDRIEVRGPIGGYFTWRVTDGGPLLLVGGGSGVVPLMAMLRHRAAQHSAVPAHLLYSSRDFDDIIYRQELERLAAADPALTIVHTLTRVQPASWTGYRRRIDRDILAEVAWAPAEQPLAFVCGPTALVEAVASTLVELGHEPQRVRTERFGPSGGSL
jgi:ferredoxin-NADP reductase